MRTTIKKIFDHIYDVFASAWIAYEKTHKNINNFFGKWQIQALTILIPVVLGFCGYFEYYRILYPEPELWTLRTPLISTIKLFVMSFDAKPHSSDPVITGTESFYVMLTIARWLAIIVTGTRLVEMLKPLNRKVFSDFKFHVIWKKKGKLLLIGSGNETMDIYRLSQDRYPMILCSSDDEFKKFWEEGFNCVKMDQEETIKSVIMNTVSSGRKECMIVINTKDEAVNLMLAKTVVEKIRDLVAEERADILTLDQFIQNLNDKKDHNELSEEEEASLADAQREILLRKGSVVSKLDPIRVVMFGPKLNETGYQKMESKSYGVLRYVRKSSMVARDLILKYPLTALIDRKQYIDEYSCVDKKMEINLIFIGFGNTNQDIFTLSTIVNQFVETGEGETAQAKEINYYAFDKTNPRMRGNLNHMIFRYAQEFLSGIDENRYRKEDYLEIAPDPAKITIKKLDTNDAAFYNEYVKICSAKADKDVINVVSVALGDDLENIDLANKMLDKAQEWGLPKTVIFANVEDTEKLGMMLDSESKASLDEVIPYGSLKEIVYDLNNIFNNEMEEIAREKHYMNALFKAAQDESNTMSDDDIKVNSLYEWYTYDADVRTSEIYSILSLRSKLQLMGLDYRKKQGGEDVLTSNEAYFAIYAKDGGPELDEKYGQIRGKDIYCYPKVLEKEDLCRQSLRQNLAVQEHLCQNGYMVSRGYIPASIHKIRTDKDFGKDTRLRTHGDLTTEEGLIEYRKIVSEVTGKPEVLTDVINYDFQLMDDAWWYLDMFGYEVYRR